MPRKYIGKSSRGRWTDLQLQGALKAVREQGISISAAAKKFGIPKTTLFNHCTGKLFFIIGRSKHVIYVRLKEWGKILQEKSFSFKYIF